MLSPRGLVLTLAGLCWMGILPVRAQTSSRQRLPDRIDRASVEQRIVERFQLSAQNTPLGLLEHVIKNPDRYGLNPQDIQKMAKEIGKRPGDFGIDLSDPEFQKMARRIAGEAQFNPDQLEMLKKFLPENLK